MTEAQAAQLIEAVHQLSRAVFGVAIQVAIVTAVLLFRRFK